MDWICPYCQKSFVFEKHQQKGAHITNCKDNPKRVLSLAKRSITNTVPRIEIVRDCKKCRKPFSQYKTAREIETNKDIAIFCSRTCANSHEVSAAHREKTSKALTGRTFLGRQHRETRQCVICSNTFECIKSDKKRACSKKCVAQLLSRILKGTGKTGGYRTKSGSSKFYLSFARIPRPLGRG